MELAVCCCGGLACCCCGSAGCFCWTALKVKNAAIKVVRNIRSRQPCKVGLLCTNNDESHLAHYSHPDDDDYGFAVRVHGGKGEFSTLRQCFNFMDPYQRGYVNELAAFRELLGYLKLNRGSRNWILELLCGNGRQISARQIRKEWEAMDTDGNKFISFPEFVEWASGPRGRALGFPEHVGIMGMKGEAGDYALACAIRGCKCEGFIAAGAAGTDSAVPATSSVGFLAKGLVSLGARPALASKTRTVRFCCRVGCGHKLGYHAATPEAQLAAVLPSNWSCVQGKSRKEVLDICRSGKSRLTDCGPELMESVQRLMDASTKRTWTRDRGRDPVPSGYKVVRVARNENPRAWLKYVLKASLIKESLTDAHSLGNLPPLEEFAMRTSDQAGPVCEAEPLDTQFNEWLLWHGAAADSAHLIAEQEFKQVYAGRNVGTLYGRGTYLSDSCTKADEYSKEAVKGKDKGLSCLLLCRVMGGRVQYTDEVTPSAERLERDVLTGPFDSVLGDREVCRGTFKEIVIYESSQAYPLYLVYYKRIYEEESAPSTSTRRG